MLERICSDVIFSNWCVCKHRVSGSLLPFPSPVLRNIPKYWQSCLFPWYTASFLLNVETVTHWFWRIPSSWKQKKILAPKRLVPSNFINYIWSLNTNRTSSYFLSTFLLFLNSTGFFAHWLGCCSWLRHQNKNTILLGCICERCFARPQAVKVWNQMGSSQMYTQRTFLPVFLDFLTLESPGWKRGSVLLYLYLERWPSSVLLLDPAGITWGHTSAGNETVPGTTCRTRTPLHAVKLWSSLRLGQPCSLPNMTGSKKRHLWSLFN